VTTYRSITAGVSQRLSIDPDSGYDVIHAPQDAAGVRRFGLHGLRHLYTSLLIESGANIKFAQAKLGHGSAMTTLDIYGQIITDQGRECADKIAANF
jgi:integrase